MRLEGKIGETPVPPQKWVVIVDQEFEPKGYVFLSYAAAMEKFNEHEQSVIAVLVP